MHSLDFFRKRGFYCLPDFLDSQAREALLERVRTAAPVPAQVFEHGELARVDMAVRNTWEIPAALTQPIGERIGALRAELSAHFTMPLSDHEGPSLLLYMPGGFYGPHTDRSPNETASTTPGRRRVSVVIFLNAMTASPAPAEYSGGALTFYGLIDDPAWRTIGFALEPTAGLLVAFPSHVVHEVTPVTAGDRYTIVDWFTA